MLWQPADIRPAAVSTAAMLAAYRPPALAERIDRFRVIQGPDAYDATAHIRGLDYRIDLRLDGSAYAFGRDAGVRWRETPAGTVRLIRSDVQSDPLDRWPEAVLGVDTAHCSAAGTSPVAGTGSDVLLCRAPGDVPHWLYLDAATGTVVREVVRDGAHVTTYTFDGPSWHVAGFGGDANAAMTSSAEPVSAAEVAIPPSTSRVFSLPASGKAAIPAEFDGWIVVPVEIDGRRLRFIVDTGSTQSMISKATARLVGLHVRLGHAIASQVRVGDASARDLPLQVVDGLTGVGILGNEFFTGHIVHIDYRRGVLELLDRTAFAPPAGALGHAADFREGMPILPGAADGTVGARFALDTGSPSILLLAPFAAACGIRPAAPLREERFLEGPVHVGSARPDEVQVGPALFERPAILAASPDPDDLDIPLDAVVGFDALRRFEWWFDYDGQRLWMRRDDA